MSYVWTVYPRHSDAAMIATGISSNPGRARRCVEAAMNDDDSAWGLLVRLGGAMEVCRRTRDGEYRWGPLWPDGYPPNLPL